MVMGMVLGNCQWRWKQPDIKKLREKGTRDGSAASSVLIDSVYVKKIFASSASAGPGSGNCIVLLRRLCANNCLYCFCSRIRLLLATDPVYSSWKL